MRAGVQGEVLGSGKVGRSRVQAAFELRPPVDAAPAVPASLKAALLAQGLASQGRHPSSFVAELGKAPRAQASPRLTCVAGCISELNTARASKQLTQATWLRQHYGHGCARRRACVAASV